MKFSLRFFLIVFTFLIIRGTATTVKDFTGGAFTIKPRDGFNYCLLLISFDFKVCILSILVWKIWKLVGIYYHPSEISMETNCFYSNYFPLNYFDIF